MNDNKLMFSLKSSSNKGTFEAIVNEDKKVTIKVDNGHKGFSKYDICQIAKGLEDLFNNSTLIR